MGMGDKTINDHLSSAATTDHNESLQWIKKFIESEFQFKQELITRQQGEIDNLKKILEDNQELITDLKQKLQTCSQTNEGNNQLINKLLGDITKLQNDIDWYKRTYERRSLLGTIKEKIKRYF
jgi:peptidoglycan hydrolase CwlO-like protein